MKCPSAETLFELVSIPEEISVWRRSHLRTHVWACKKCKEKSVSLSTSWRQYLSPEPDITSSIMRVYSSLQRDETLILKGWKLRDTVAPRRDARSILLKEGWLFRGAVGMGLAAAVSFVLWTQPGSSSMARKQDRRIPLAQIRVEEKNSVRVHYLEPELLQTVEFETTSAR